MIAIATILITLLGMGLSYFLVQRWVARQTKTLDTVNPQSANGGTDQVQILDTAVSAAIEAISTRVPLDELKNAKGELDKLLAQSQDERKRLREIEIKLRESQAAVGEQEGRHSALKSGKEECDKLAAEVRAAQEGLKRAYQDMQTELEASQSRIQTLLAQLNITQEQRQALENVQSALRQAAHQLRELSDGYDMATQRFLNLQEQYHELEKEYRKLIDRELSGETTTA